MGTDLSQSLERFRGRASAAEIFSEWDRTVSLTFQGDGLHSVQEDDQFASSARAVADGRLGFSSTSDPRGGDELVENVLETTLHGRPVELDFPGERPAPSVATYDQATAETALPRLIALGNDLLKELSGRYPKGAHRVRLTRSVAEWRLENTAGLNHHTEETGVTLSLMSTLSESDDLFTCGSFVSCRRLADASEVLERLFTYLRWGARRVDPPTGRLPVVFLPEGVRILIAPLLDGANGTRVTGKSSPLASREGEQVLDGRISITLDATRPFGSESLPRDHEGVPTRPLPIFEAGTYRGCYHDLSTAARAGVESTGHGTRGRLSAPYPRPGNVEVAGGQLSFQQMIADIEDGLLVESVIGGGQGNTITGALSNTVGLAFRIRDGEIVGRTRDVSLAGNVYDLLREQLHSLSADRREVGGLLAPAIRLEGVNLVA